MEHSAFSQATAVVRPAWRNAECYQISHCGKHDQRFLRMSQTNRPASCYRCALPSKLDSLHNGVDPCAVSFAFLPASSSRLPLLRKTTQPAQSAELCSILPGIT